MYVEAPSGHWFKNHPKKIFLRNLLCVYCNWNSDILGKGSNPGIQTSVTGQLIEVLVSLPFGFIQVLPYIPEDPIIMHHV